MFYNVELPSNILGILQLNSYNIDISSNCNICRLSSLNLIS